MIDLIRFKLNIHNTYFNTKTYNDKISILVLKNVINV